MQWKQKDAIIGFVETDTTLTKLAKINGIKDIFGFLNPSKEDLHSPLLLKNVELAARRIIEAINKNEKITIHIDNDQDGITSFLTMYQFLLNFTKNITFMYSQRAIGHGLNYNVQDVPDDTDLLIVVDSSSNDVEATKIVKDRGIDVIILDHHLCDVVNPYCILVNPQQEGCEYPNKQSSGAVIVWKTIKTIDLILKTKYSDEFYDIVGIGLYGDLMSVGEDSKENRYIVDRCLRNIRNKSIRLLLEKQTKDLEKLRSSVIGFSISPFLNACTRLGKIEVILDYLIETDINNLLSKVENIIDINNERKRLQAEHTERILPFVDGTKPMFIIVDENIDSGFRGLVANDLKEKFKICTMIVSEDKNDTYSGSYRATDGFNLKSTLSSIKEIIHTGGHNEAGGCSFKRKDLKKILNKLNVILAPNMLNQYIEYDLSIDLANLKEKDIVDFEQFYHISGKGIESGKCRITNCRVLTVDMLGKKEKNTVKIGVYPMSETFFLDDSDIKDLKPTAYLMKFRTNENFFSKSLIGSEIEVIGEPNLNVYKNTYQKNKVTKTNQLFLEDFRVIV